MYKIIGLYFHRIKNKLIILSVFKGKLLFICYLTLIIRL